MLGLSSPNGQLRNVLGGGYGSVAKEIDASGKLDPLEDSVSGWFRCRFFLLDEHWMTEPGRLDDYGILIVVGLWKILIVDWMIMDNYWMIMEDWMIIIF
jgi:hypothetical protein